MHIDIDLDETIAAGALAFARYYCQQLDLPFDSRLYDSITTYEEVMQLPMLVRFCRASAANMQRFHTVQERARSCPDLFRQLGVMEGAREGVQFLSERATIRYSTVRAAELEPATRTWLAQHGFVNSTNLLFCRSSQHKLRCLAAQPGRLVLIDDRVEQIIHAHQQLQHEQPTVASDLATRLTLLAFGATLLPSQDALRVIALPSWNTIAEVFSCLL